MIPQYDDPCLKCKHLRKERGLLSYECLMGRYDSTSMVIFGYCGFFCKKKGRPFKAPFPPACDD